MISFSGISWLIVNSLYLNGIISSFICSSICTLKFKVLVPSVSFLTILELFKSQIREISLLFSSLISNVSIVVVQPFGIFKL